MSRSPRNNRSKSNRTFRRTAIIAALSMLSFAIIASPAAAANQLPDVSSNAVAIVIATGGLLFAVVYELWRSALHKAEPVRVRVKNDSARNVRTR